MKWSHLFFLLSLSAFSSTDPNKGNPSPEILKIERVELFASLSQLEYRKGTIKPMPEDKKLKIINEYKLKMIHDLDKLDGKIIDTDGFVILIRLEEFASEFMMVGDPMFCSHVAPPPPNQVIHVKMKEGIKGLSTKNFEDITRVKIQGVLKVIRKASEYGSAGFELIATKVEKI